MLTTGSLVIAGGSYRPSTDNLVPSSINSDAFGDPDCPGCGYQVFTSQGLRGPYHSPYGFPDINQPPGSGFEWRGTGPIGSSEGSWYNPNTNEYIRLDIYHHGVTHIDYRAPDGRLYWI